MCYTVSNRYIIYLKYVYKGDAHMADYQKMYYILCQAVDLALEVLPEDGETARQVLQKAMDEAEDKFIETAGD